ncbi:Craniofacial development protein 2 [Holothuria leucospilota]|uniref:Craniofacial development protein 2 n=1 Tax=Holothuria leucospilota TaxID=206669 RepID=A0A9Q1HIE9_HOLLE|nr:Craniofacial development protein 2 [Holothuria leucospilota]
MGIYKIQILGLSEGRWLNSRQLIKEGYVIYFSGNDKHHVNGVGILVEKKLARSVQGYWPISDRVMMAKMNTRPFNIVIIQVYAPTSAHSIEEIEKFYEEISKALDQVPSQDMLVVMGDLNAKIGQGEDGIEQHPRRLYTWKMPGDRSRNKINSIMVRNQFKNSFKNVQTYPGADVGSDHSLLMAKLKLQFKIPRKKALTDQKDLDCLRMDKMKKRYAIEVSNKYDALMMEENEQTPTVERMWDCMKHSTKYATETVLPKRGKEKMNKWMTEDILDLMNVRKRSKSEEEYQRIDKEIKSKCKRAKEAWYNSRCEETEELERIHDVKRMHEKVKDLTDRRRHIKISGSCIKSNDWNMLFERDNISKRWVEYISDLYSDANRPQCTSLENLQGPDILTEEVEAAVKNLKNGKAPCCDGIRAEELKALDSKGNENVNITLQ